MGREFRERDIVIGRIKGLTEIGVNDVYLLL